MNATCTYTPREVRGFLRRELDREYRGSTPDAIRRVAAKHNIDPRKVAGILVGASLPQNQEA